MPDRPDYDGLRLPPRVSTSLISRCTTEHTCFTIGDKSLRTSPSQICIIAAFPVIPWHRDKFGFMDNRAIVVSTRFDIAAV